MTATPTPPRRPPRNSAAAFTLTEVLIALALVAVLLIGITKIFEITSKTIATGQALSKAVRTQKAIQQTISADLLGTLPTSANVRPYSGMMPVNDATDPDAGMPFLTIGNFRVPTYINQAAMAADSIAPTDAVTNWVARSALIRGTDLNKDGTESTASVASPGGETVPLFFYGERNFRCDTIGFFVRGSFHSQTGLSAVTTGAAVSTSQGELDSSEAYVWYGQTRVFNSEATQIDATGGFGSPGMWLTSTGLPNRNNRFAEQFVLGRMQFLLSEPIDHDSRVGTWKPSDSNTSAAIGVDYDDGGADRKLAETNTIVASNDPSKPGLFIQRNWWDPRAQHIVTKSGTGLPARPQLSPFTITSSVVLYKTDTATPAAGRNFTVYTSDRTTKVDVNDNPYQALFGRTDIAGVGMRQARQRARFVEQWDIDQPTPLAQDEWWENLWISWNSRVWTNPFVSTTPYNRNEPNVNSKSMAQRQQIVATGVSQFIVEFAGDFVTQRTDPNQPGNPGPIGEVIGLEPDGVVDFVVQPNGGLVTRWYGMARDIDGDGSIPATPATARTSIDVLPVHRIIPTTLFPTGANFWLPFERTSTASASPPPPSIDPVAGNYANNVTDAGSDPAATRYLCVWGARDFEGGKYEIDPLPLTNTARRPPIRVGYPSLLRFVVDLRDENDKLQEPVTQQLVYRVPDDLPQPAN